MAETNRRKTILRLLLHGLWWLVLFIALAFLLASLPSYLRRGMQMEPAAESSSLAQVVIWVGALLSLSSVIVSIALASLMFWKKETSRWACSSHSFCSRTESLFVVRST